MVPKTPKKMSRIEENHDFLKEKQEHPIYPKREQSEKPVEEIPKPEEKKKKKKEDDQLSLF